MTTQKKPTPAAEKQSVAANPSQEEVLARYMDAVKMLDLMRQQLEASGIKLEVPPSETTVVRDERALLEDAKRLPDVPPPDPRKLATILPGAAVDGTYKPWTKIDLDGQEKFQVVPQMIPGAVHPLKDKEGKWHIFLDVNGLKACLTVWEINTLSGMFYHAYKNIEDQWKATEDYKVKGPIDAPWVNGGLGGINTWYYQGEAPASWINIDGGYYKPGDEMPLDDIPDIRPVS